MFRLHGLTTNMFRRSRMCAAAALGLVLLAASPAAAQLRGALYVSGLSHPVAFVQDPSNAAVQFVVEQGGVIRVIQGGALSPAAFLDLSGEVSNGGERGLLSLAFAPSDSGRFFVTFINGAGNTVVSRFRRSADPLVGDPSTRFDLQWSTGNRFIAHPEQYHYGGNLVFGADGYLYIGLGDGGEPDDASHQAQDLSKLYGKMLRLDVNVGDGDPEGFDIPPGNPFANGAGAPEIWSIGFRNPWRFTLDDPARGGTGAFLIADVGENAVEEIDYEPAGRPGRNYGWRNREGSTDHQTSLPPAYEPLVDPIHQYDHGTGRSITGGYVYRGAAIPSLAGRYVFGDFVRGRVWSLALSVDPTTGEASASDVREHTAELNAGASVRMISSFGVDAAGELYIVNYGDGTIVSVSTDAGPPPPPPPSPLLQIDLPYAGSRVHQPFTLAGWAIDATAATTGISTLHVWAFPASGAAPQFLGVANSGGERGDVAAFFGLQFGRSGYNLSVTGLAAGDWLIAIYGWVDAMGGWGIVRTVPVTVEAGTLLVVDVPSQSSVVGPQFQLAGWAADPGASTGTGVDTIHVWAFDADGVVGPRFVGVPQFVDRPDVGAYLGSRFTHAGYNMLVSGLGTGTWDLYVFAHSAVSNAFDAVKIVRVVSR